MEIELKYAIDHVDVAEEIFQDPYIQMIKDNRQKNLSICMPCILTRKTDDCIVRALHSA